MSDGSLAGQLSPPVAVEAFGLSRRYVRRWALVDVSFELARGKSLMVAGRNGSGKSTLLRVLATALRPDRGTGRIEGKDLSSERQEVRDRIAILAHQTYLYESLTALENLGVAARFLHRPHDRAALLPLLEEVGLADRADDTPATFSAGMRRRLSLARVLLKRASVVLLDEPYSQLDPPGFRLVDRYLERLRAAGATVLMATHLLERGASVCDQAILLEQGRLAWSGAAADLATHSGWNAARLTEGGA